MTETPGTTAADDRSGVDTAEAFEAGRAYLDHLSEATVAVVLNINGESQGWMEDAAALIDVTATYGPAELRAFVSGVHHAAEAQIENLHCQRPRVVIVDGDYALGVEGT